MALIMNDLEMNVALSTSEMADVNGGKVYRLPVHRFHYQRPGKADAYGNAIADGINYADTGVKTFALSEFGHALSSTEAYSSAG